MTTPQCQKTKTERDLFDLANVIWLMSVREAFHTYLVQHEGYDHPPDLPKPGGVYPGSHAQTLWECWLAATLHERERAVAVCKDEIKVRNDAANKWPADSAQRDRCHAAARGACNCAAGIGAGEKIGSASAPQNATHHCQASGSLG